MKNLALPVLITSLLLSLSAHADVNFSTVVKGLKESHSPDYVPPTPPPVFSYSFAGGGTRSTTNTAEDMAKAWDGDAGTSSKAFAAYYTNSYIFADMHSDRTLNGFNLSIGFAVSNGYGNRADLQIGCIKGGFSQLYRNTYIWSNSSYTVMNFSFDNQCDSVRVYTRDLGKGAPQFIIYELSEKNPL